MLHFGPHDKETPIHELSKTHELAYLVTSDTHLLMFRSPEMENDCLCSCFRLDKYYRVDLKSKRVDPAMPPYPRSIGRYWLGCTGTPGLEK